MPPGLEPLLPVPPMFEPPTFEPLLLEPPCPPLVLTNFRGPRITLAEHPTRFSPLGRAFW
jgi:hypothetical protein